MRMISFEEYDALKAYMEPKLFELWKHENKIRKEKGLEELNSFQVGFRPWGCSEGGALCRICNPTHINIRICNPH